MCINFPIGLVFPRTSKGKKITTLKKKCGAKDDNHTVGWQTID